MKYLSSRLEFDSIIRKVFLEMNVIQIFLVCKSICHQPRHWSIFKIGVYHRIALISSKTNLSIFWPLSWLFYIYVLDSLYQNFYCWISFAVQYFLHISSFWNSSSYYLESTVVYNKISTLFVNTLESVHTKFQAKQIH